MKIVQNGALLAVVLVAAALSAGCETHQRAATLDGHDLDEMTSVLAPKLLQIPEITQNPNRITIVCKGGNNKTDVSPTNNVDIFADQMYGKLAGVARDRITFLADNATYQRYRSEEVGNTDPMEAGSRYPGAAPDPTVQPDYALYCDVLSLNSDNSTYYLCQFRLLNLHTRVLVWSGDWDTNKHHLTVY